MPEARLAELRVCQMGQSHRRTSKNDLFQTLSLESGDPARPPQPELSADSYPIPRRELDDVYVEKYTYSGL